MILVDAGPLVALIDADDKHHQACASVMKRLRPPLIIERGVVQSVKR